MDDARIEHVPDRRRYVISDGGEVAGFTSYRLPDDLHVAFMHTEIGESFAGRGLAGALVAEALADVRARSKRIIPYCPYVARWLRTHEGFADITDWPEAKP